MIPFRPTQANRFLPPPAMMGQRGNVGPIDFGVNTPMPIPQPQPQIRTMEDRMGAGQQVPMPATSLPYNVPQGPQVNTPPVNLPFRPPNFGQTQQQPFQPQPQPQPQPPPAPQQRVPGVNAPIDFADEYAKLNANRPNRLAYQQAINEGSPQIKRGKLAKLGAIIAAAGGAAGYGNQAGGAQAGANLGLSSYYSPQSRADEAYDKKTKGLAHLAQFEESDLQNQIKALEVKHGDYWKQQEADRFARGENRADTAEARLGKMSDAQIEEMKANREESNWMKYNNTKTGKMMIYNRITGKTQEVGDIGLTTDEQFDQFKKELVEKERVLEVGRRAGDLRDRETQWGTADRNNLSKQAIADANNATKIQQTLGKMGNVNKMLKPGEAATQVWNDLTGTIATDKKSFANMGDISDYIDVEGLGTSNAIVKIKPPSYWDSDEDKAIKEKLRATIEESYKRVNTKPPSTTPNLTTPKVVAPQVTGPGGRNTGPALPPGFTFRDK